MANEAKRVALITGGSSGIGLEMAKQMTAEGATVLIVGRDQTKLDAAKKEIPGVEAIPCDITDSDDRIGLSRLIENEFPSLNMLVNNAGRAQKYLLESTPNLEQHLDDEYQLNFVAPVVLAQLLLPTLAKNNGTVINATTGLVYVPIMVEPSYSASKAALHSMTQSMRYRFEKLGVKVVEVLYPAVDTPFHDDGQAPDIAIKPEKAARLALKGINKGKSEVRVLFVSQLYVLSRLAPKTTMRLINKVVPDDADTTLAGN